MRASISVTRAASITAWINSVSAALAPVDLRDLVLPASLSPRPLSEEHGWCGRVALCVSASAR
jgi:hypothetical protein